MKREIALEGSIITYELEYKKVKNINLRVKRDGRVYVSAPRRVAYKVIDDFVASKASFIHKAKAHLSYGTGQKEHFREDEIRGVILDMCRRVYPIFEKRGVAYPEIKFRRMISRWGSCHAKKGILTFNTNLMYAPPECVEYVVLHEFTHFLQQNHSACFYGELAKVCPDWKQRRMRLRDVHL